MASYREKEGQVEEILNASEGPDQVIYYIEETKQMKKLPANKNVRADKSVLAALEGLLSKGNVKVR